MLTVISWYAARKARKTMQQLVMQALTDRPTLLAVVADKYSSEDHLQPFAPVAERFGDRLDVILVAEWEQGDREREGEALLRGLGLLPAVRPRLLRDQGAARTGLVLRAKKPIAIIELFFEERGPEPRGAEMTEREERIIRQLQELLVRLPPQPPPPQMLPGAKRDDSPPMDRFELIELD